MRRVATLLVLAGLTLVVPAFAWRAQAPSCDPDNGGLKLPAGFCATVFADSVRGSRQLAVAPNGDVFVGVNGTPNQPGGVLALRDADKDGRAEVREKILSGFSSSHVGLYGGYLYTEFRQGGGRGAPAVPTMILRYPLPAEQLKPGDKADTIVASLPSAPGHSTRNFVITPQGVMYVNVGSATNSCQAQDRTAGAPGRDPCTELETRAGIWRFDANKTGQTQAGAARFATGIRNAVGIALHPSDNRLWVTQHGRDDLWGWRSKLGITDSVAASKFNAETPAEELFQVNNGDDFGWPYCYFDGAQKKKVLAPEYGGDGKQVGRCADTKGNAAAFPAHWAPNALLFYTGSNFPAKYKNGAFIAFHGSWNRAPEVPGGYNVVFQPMTNGRASGAYEVFADGLPANLTGPQARGARRPTGLAQGPDGALYVSDDATGRIWKVTYAGGK